MSGGDDGDLASPLRLSAAAYEKSGKVFDKLVAMSNSVLGTFCETHAHFEGVTSDYDAPEVICLDAMRRRPLGPAVLPFDEEEPSVSARKITVLVALADFEGEIVLPMQKVNITSLRRGDALVFPSCALHPFAIYPSVCRGEDGVAFAMNHLI